MASLYDDFEDKAEPAQPSWGMKMMETHVALRNKQQIRRKPLNSAMAPTLAPVIDLKRSAPPSSLLNSSNNTTAEGEYKFNLQTGQLERVPAMQSTTGGLFTSSNASFLADSCVSTGTGEDEYNPLRPNDYDQLVKQRREKRRREEDSTHSPTSFGDVSSGHSEEEEAPAASYHRRGGGGGGGGSGPRASPDHRHRSQHRSSGAAPTSTRDRYDRGGDRESRGEHSSGNRDRDHRRSSRLSNSNSASSSHRDREREREQRVGAAIAPPPSLSEDTMVHSGGPVEEVSGKYGINNVAAKMMARMGYREGQGLGREGQGMSTALTVEKTSRRGGKIIHERDAVTVSNAGPNASTSADMPPPRPVIMPTVALSNVVLLQNMVGPGEVDDDLEPETKEECGKYGPVTACVIYEIPDAPEENAVRIFVEFVHPESALKAICELNGRFFGGRTVSAGFYDEDKFKSLELSLPPL